MLSFLIGNYSHAAPTATSQNVSCKKVLFTAFLAAYKAAIRILLSGHCCRVSAYIKSIKECVVPSDGSLLFVIVFTFTANANYMDSS